MASLRDPNPGCYAGPKVGAIVVAAGTSSRMGGVDKIFAPVLGQPLVSYCLDALEKSPSVDLIVLVLDARSIRRGEELVSERGYGKVVSVCPGGARRQDSVFNGLQALGKCDWIIVHDGARPCLDDGIVRRGLAAATQYGAAVAGVPCKDTIKVISPDALVQDTPDRDSLYAAQTPQVFRRRILMEAHQTCSVDVTDDAMMVETLGNPVKMFLGAYENLKVTTPEDLPLVEAFLRERVKVKA